MFWLFQVSAVCCRHDESLVNDGPAAPPCFSSGFIQSQPHRPGNILNGSRHAVDEAITLTMIAPIAAFRI